MEEEGATKGVEASKAAPKEAKSDSRWSPKKLRDVAEFSAKGLGFRV